MAEVTICSDFGAPKIKSVTVSTGSPSICHEVMGPDEKVSLKLNIQKPKIMASGSITDKGSTNLYVLLIYCSPNLY